MALAISFEKHSLTGFGRSHDKSALALAYGREHIYHPGGEIIGRPAGEIELLFGEERSEMLKGHTVADKLGRAAIDLCDTGEGEIFFGGLGGRTEGLDYIALLETILLDLLLGDVDIVGRRHIVVVGRAEESVALGHNLKHTLRVDDTIEVESVLRIQAVGLLIVLLLLIELTVFLVFLALTRERLLGLLLLPRLGDHNRC